MIIALNQHSVLQLITRFTHFLPDRFKEKTGAEYPGNSGTAEKTLSPGRFFPLSAGSAKKSPHTPARAVQPKNSTNNFFIPKYLPDYFLLLSVSFQRFRP